MCLKWLQVGRAAVEQLNGEGKWVVGVALRQLYSFTDGIQLYSCDKQIGRAVMQITAVAQRLISFLWHCDDEGRAGGHGDRCNEEEPKRESSEWCLCICGGGGLNHLPLIPYSLFLFLSTLPPHRILVMAWFLPYFWPCQPCPQRDQGRRGKTLTLRDVIMGHSFCCTWTCNFNGFSRNGNSSNAPSSASALPIRRFCWQWQKNYQIFNLLVPLLKLA